MYTNIIFNSISAVCLIVATIFSYRNFALLKTIENENHFYKYKMESAQKLLVASMSLINQFQDIMSEVFELKKQNKFGTEANKVVDTKIDFYFDEFRKSVIENSLFLPQILLVKLNYFLICYLKKSIF